MVDHEKDQVLSHNEYHQDDKSSDVEKSPPEGFQHGKEADDIPWTAKRMIAVLSLCTIYVGSQIILYFTSSALTSISQSLGTTIGNWMLTANTLAVAAICPFVGYITDLMGRRNIALLGTLLLLIACTLQATAHSLAQAIAAQAIGGMGAGMAELVALAGSVPVLWLAVHIYVYIYIYIYHLLTIVYRVAEITPVRWRGVTLALVTFSIVPFMPQLLYTILIVRSSTWRYCFLLCALW